MWTLRLNLLTIWMAELERLICFDLFGVTLMYQCGLFHLHMLAKMVSMTLLLPVKQSVKLLSIAQLSTQGYIYPWPELL